VTPKTEAQYQAESDLRTLEDAEQIGSDKKRSKAAQAEGVRRQKALAKVMSKQRPVPKAKAKPAKKRTAPKAKPPRKR